MRSRLLAPVTVLACACSSGPRNPVLDSYPADIAGHTTVTYYDIHGHTLSELREEMRREGPKTPEGSFVGETRSPMRWSWRAVSGGTSTCMLRDITMSVNAQVLLPRWTPPADAEPGLVTEWNRFIAALETHESGHKDISARAAHDIVEQLRNLSGTCAIISMRANDIAQQIVARADAQQKAYDADTRHGLTQGTGFGAPRFLTDFALVPAPRTGTVRGTFSVDIDSLWASLPAAFTAIGLSVNVKDASRYAVADTLTVRGAVDGVPIVQVADCGAPPPGRSADSVDVTLFVTSHLEPASPSGTWMVNTVQANVRAPDGKMTSCLSHGALERRLLSELRQRIKPNR